MLIRTPFKEKDVKGVVSREKRYATLAKKEGDYAKKKEAQEKAKHEPEMAKDSKREAKIADAFSRVRRGIATEEAKKLKGKK
jgi:hypothetical protein